MPNLKNDVAITVTYDDKSEMVAFAPPAGDIKEFNQNPLHPTGITINYGINTIPTAILDLTPKDIKFICQFDTYRRTPIKIKVESTQGCMTFRGLIDGMSMSQGVGDIKLQLVVKSPFQILNEINPKLLGYHSAGVEFTRRIDVLRIEQASNQFKAFRYIIGSNIQIDFQQPLFTGIVAILKAMVESQINWKLTQTAVGASAEAAIKAAESMAAKHLKMATQLLNKIDVSFVPTDLTLADFTTADWVLQGICETRNNMLDIFLTILDTVGCALVIGNDKAFVVPNSGFFKQRHISRPINQGEITQIPNVLYPAQYNNVSFNDNGFRDIAGVYVMGDDKNIETIDGFFQDEVNGGNGGIIGEVMPYVISYNNAALRSARKIQTIAAIGDSTLAHTPKDTSVATAQANRDDDKYNLLVGTAIQEGKVNVAAQQELRKIRQDTFKNMVKFSNDWAQLRYFQLKYTDRIGGISTMFMPKFVPGAVGTVYLKAPGVYVDLFVTGVTHEIRMNIPDTGIAITNVHFNCGRIGSIFLPKSNIGLEKLNLFKGFNADSSAQMATAFLKDTQ